jgi:hypothetical protein
MSASRSTHRVAVRRSASRAAAGAVSLLPYDSFVELTGILFIIILAILIKG